MFHVTLPAHITLRRLLVFLCVQSCSTFCVCSPVLHFMCAVLFYILCVQSCSTFYVCSPVQHFVRAVLFNILCVQSCSTFYVCSPVLHFMCAVLFYILCVQSCSTFYVMNEERREGNWLSWDNSTHFLVRLSEHGQNHNLTLEQQAPASRIEGRIFRQQRKNSKLRLAKLQFKIKCYMFLSLILVFLK